MWFVRWLFTLLLMLYAVLFAAMNLDEITLRIPYIPILEIQPTSKAVVVLLAVAVGVLIWAIVAFVGSLDFRRRIRQLERQNRDLKLELTNLRNKSILDDNELESDKALPASAPRPGALDLPPYDYERDEEELSQARKSER